MTPLLKNKNAIIYGAGGFIGRVVARTFAREGAILFVVGRTEALAAGGRRRDRLRGWAGRTWRWSMPWTSRRWRSMPGDVLAVSELITECSAIDGGQYRAPATNSGSTRWNGRAIIT